MNDYQVLGSAITYLRRYALSAMLGIVTDKDTDASGEQKKTNATKKQDNRPWLNQNTEAWEKAVDYLVEGGSMDAIEKKYRISKDNKTELLKEVTDKV